MPNFVNFQKHPMSDLTLLKLDKYWDVKDLIGDFELVENVLALLFVAAPDKV